MGKTERAHHQAALTAGCITVVQLSAVVPALLAKEGAPTPFYLERQQWEASQCTAERYMKYQVPQWDSYFLGSATYSRNIFLGSFQAVCMFQGYSWRKISKACKNEWLAWTPCLHLGLKILWCFIIVFRLVVRPIAIWSHSCSGHDQILTWSSALNWTGPSCALWLEVKAWPPSFYTPPSTLLLCKMS